MKYITVSILLLISFYSSAQKDVEINRLQAIVDSTSDYNKKMAAAFDLAKQLSLLDVRRTLTLIDDALNTASKQGDSLYVARFTQVKGRAYAVSGLLDSAVFYYYKAIPFFERHGKPDDVAWLYNDLARTGRKTKDYVRAIEFYDKALQIFRASNNAEGEATILNESGVIFEYQGNYDEALSRYQQSLDIQRVRKDPDGIGYSLAFIGVAMGKKDELKQAEAYLLEAMRIRLQRRDSFAIAFNYADLGDVYAKQKSYRKAIEAYEQALAHASRLKVPDLEMEIHLAISKMYDKVGNSARAYFHLTANNWLKDSIYNIDKMTEIEDISAKYQTARQKAQLLQQQIEINKRNNAIILAVILFGVAAVLTVSYYKRLRLKQKNKLQQAIFEQQQMAIQAVMEAEEKERSRIARDLHDGVGQMMSAVKMNLSSIESQLQFAERNQQEKFSKIVHMVDESCKEVRHVSHNMMPNVMTKTSFEEALRTFFDHLDGDKLQVHLFTDGLKDDNNKNIESVLYRVVQECVNNTIKHAGASQLDVTIIQDENAISGTIEDNGKGFDMETEGKKGGIGLMNIKRRIEFLKGEIEWNSAPGNGTCISFSVPL